MRLVIVRNKNVDKMMLKRNSNICFCRHHKQRLFLVSLSHFIFLRLSKHHPFSHYVSVYHCDNSFWWDKTLWNYKIFFKKSFQKYKHENQYRFFVIWPQLESTALIPKPFSESSNIYRPLCQNIIPRNPIYFEVKHHLLHYL